jgi:hypothetical protein
MMSVVIKVGCVFAFFLVSAGVSAKEPLAGVYSSMSYHKSSGQLESK